MTTYKLRYTIAGHEKDVRCLSTWKDNTIISGSRDVTACYWQASENQREFDRRHVLEGHENFLASVTFVQPYRNNETGIIFTGSNDKTIRAYDAEGAHHLFTLKGHLDTVCSLAFNNSCGLLLSCSWDKTARLWRDDQCVTTLAGHEAAVWTGVFLPNGDGVITGSADKTLRLWRPMSFSQAKFSCEQKYIGHCDCVRGVAMLNAEEFVSCGNDATVRIWKISGECIRELYGHTNFIYGVSVLPSGNEFITCGEDRSVRVWDATDGRCVQNMVMPCQSVWCIAALSNGDFAVGGNDAMIRIFTRSPDRTAPDTELQVFSEQLSSTVIPGNLGDIKLDQVPGPEILTQPGRSEGFVTMVKKNSKVECYQWSEGQWSKIGDVVGSSGGTQQTSGKQLFEGREYDYVFTVDVVEGAPPLKLPYNITEDPFMTAQNFIYKHNLPQSYLEEIANFISKQVQGPTLQQTSQQTSSYVDPFTGGARYIPGTGAQTGGSGFTSDPLTGGSRYIPGTGVQTGGSGFTSDPLTGGSRYIPNSQSGVPNITPSSVFEPSSNFFPVKEVVTFDAANVEALLRKLREFNASASEQLSEAVLDQLPDLVQRDGASHTAALDAVLTAAFAWDSGKKIPLLDILRLAVRNARSNQHVFSKPSVLQELLAMAEGIVPEAAQMLIYRTICNACAHTTGREAVMARATELLDHVKGRLPAVLDSSNKNFQVAFVSVLLNIAVISALSEETDVLITEVLLIFGAQLVTSGKLPPEGTFRVLVALGTLVTSLRGNDRQTLVRSSGLLVSVSKVQPADERIQKVTHDLKLLLSKS